MTFAFLLNEYRSYGGVQRDCVGLAKVCVGRGHRVCLLTRRWSGEVLEHPGIAVTLLGTRGFSNRRRDAHFIEGARAWLRGHAVDLAVGFLEMPGLDVYFAADPCYEAKARRLRRRWYRWTRRYRLLSEREKQVFQRGRKTEVLLLHPGEVEVYADLYGTERSRLHVLPPGIRRVDASEAGRSEARASVRVEFGVGEDTLIALLVGSGFRTKGLDRVLRAVAGLPDEMRRQILLLVAGQDNERPFARLAKRLGIAERVRFLGGRSDAGRLMEASDLLLHPAYSENTGTVLLEALVRGLPVVASAVCGFAPHVKASGGGVVIPEPFDQAVFTREVARLLGDAGHRGQLSAAGIDYGHHQDLYSCHARAADLLERFAAEKGEGRKSQSRGLT